MQFLGYLQTKIRIKEDSDAKSINSRLREEIRVQVPTWTDSPEFSPQSPAAVLPCVTERWSQAPTEPQHRLTPNQRVCGKASHLPEDLQN